MKGFIKHEDAINYLNANGKFGEKLMCIDPYYKAEDVLGLLETPVEKAERLEKEVAKLKRKIEKLESASDPDPQDGDSVHWITMKQAQDMAQQLLNREKAVSYDKIKNLSVKGYLPFMRKGNKTLVSGDHLQTIIKDNPKLFTRKVFS